MPFLLVPPERVGVIGRGNVISNIRLRPGEFTFQSLMRVTDSMGTNDIFNENLRVTDWVGRNRFRVRVVPHPTNMDGYFLRNAEQLPLQHRWGYTPNGDFLDPPGRMPKFIRFARGPARLLGPVGAGLQGLSLGYDLGMLSHTVHDDFYFNGPSVMDDRNAFSKRWDQFANSRRHAGRIAFDQTIGTLYHPWVAAGKPVMVTGVAPPVPPTVTMRAALPIVGLFR